MIVGGAENERNVIHFAAINDVASWFQLGKSVYEIDATTFVKAAPIKS